MEINPEWSFIKGKIFVIASKTQKTFLPTIIIKSWIVKKSFQCKSLWFHFLGNNKKNGEKLLRDAGKFLKVLWFFDRWIFPKFSFKKIIFIFSYFSTNLMKILKESKFSASSNVKWRKTWIIKGKSLIIFSTLETF